MKLGYFTHKDPLQESVIQLMGVLSTFFLKFTICWRLYCRNTSWESTQESVWLSTCCQIVEGSCDLLHEGSLFRLGSYTNPPAAKEIRIQQEPLPLFYYENVRATSVASPWLLSSQPRSPSWLRTGIAGGTAVAFDS